MISLNGSHEMSSLNEGTFSHPINGSNQLLVLSNFSSNSLSPYSSYFILSISFVAEIGMYNTNESFFTVSPQPYNSSLAQAPPQPFALPLVQNPPNFGPSSTGGEPPVFQDIQVSNDSTKLRLDGGSSVMSSELTSSYVLSEAKSDCISSSVSGSAWKSQSEQYSIPVSVGKTPNRHNGDSRKKAQKWTKEEDMKLTEVVKQLGDCNWKNIAACTWRE